jgi:hypothetical protein
MKKTCYLLFICLLALQMAVNAQEHIFWGVLNSNISSVRLDGTSASSGTSIAQTLSGNGVTNYTAIPTLNSYAGSPITGEVLVNLPPDVDQPEDQVVCNNGATAAVNYTGSIAGTTYIWTNTSTAIGLAVSGTGNIPSFTATNPTKAPVTATVTVTPLNLSSLGFESGLFSPDWETIGAVSITGVYGGVNPTEGALQAHLVNQSGIDITALEAFLLQPAGSIDTYLGHANTEGSAIKRTVTVKAGDIMYVDYNFITTENIPSQWDAALLSISGNGLTMLASTYNSDFITIAGNPGNDIYQTGYKTFTYTFLSAGTYTIGLLPLNGYDSETNSGLLVDNFRINSGLTAEFVGTPKTFKFTINPTPTATATPSSAAICSGTTTNITLTSSPTGASFTWTAATASGTVNGTSASSGTSIAQTLSGNGVTNYTVTPTLNSCAGSPITVGVMLNPYPTITATPSSAVLCSGTATNIALTSSPTGSSFAWTAATASGTVNGTSASSGTSIAQTLSGDGVTNYTVSPTLNRCTGSPITVAITVNPNPVATATPSSAAICSGTATNIALTSSPTGASFAWTAAIAGGTVNGTSASSGTSIAQTLSGNGIANYTVTPTLNSCAGSPITVPITVNPLIVPTITGPASTCMTSTGNVYSTATGMTDYTWNVSAGGTITTGTNTNDINVTWNTAGAQTVSVNYNDVNSCSAATTTTVYNIMVKPNPVATATPSSAAINSGVATSIALTSAPTGSAFTWTTATAGGTVNGTSASSGTTIAQTLTGNGVVNYIVTPLLNGCSGTPITVEITVNGAPSDIALSASAVNENVTANTTAGTLSSTDQDTGNTFTYTLVSGTGSTDNAYFNISGSSLRITNSPDFETKNSYSVRIRTTDQGSLTYEKAFTITINDLNDVVPEISAAQTFTINENLANSSNIGIVGASDGDVGTTFSSWTITGGNTGDAFAINAATGNITVNNSSVLNRELVSSFSLTVTVSDGVNTSTPQIVTVNLNDVNDVAPVLTAALILHVTEQLPNGTTVGTALATDGDVTATTFQNWTITAGNSDGYFAINSSTGVITVVDNTVLNPFVNPNFTLTLTVSDGTNTSLSQTVLIVVDGVNDENPVITASQSFAIDENSANSTTVGQVLATDPDYGTVFQDWTLAAGNTGNAFAINPSTGVITVNNSAALNHETIASLYLSVTVNDGLHTSASQIVTVNLNDVNETPTDMALSNSTINENVAANSTVGTLSTTDPDVADSFTYSLVTGSGDTDNASCTISGNSLRITDSPDFETKSSYSVRVHTTDQGGLTYEKAFTVIVNPAPAEPTAGINSYTYDGTEKTASATVADGIVIDWYEVPSGGITISAPSGTNVGTYSAYAEARNSVTECVSVSRTLITLQITKAMLTVTSDAQTKVYDEVNPELTFKYSGWENGETESVLDAKPVASTIVDLTTEVGIYTDAIKIGSGSDNNYDFTYVANKFEVTKAMLTITTDAQTKVYGAANPELTFKYSGWKNNDTESVLDTKPVSSTTVDMTTEVGTYTDAITAGSGSDNNYDFTYVANEFEVTKAMLTITVDSQTKGYGAANPELTLEYSGWKNNDTESVLDTKPTAVTSVDLATEVGTYTDAITVSSGADNNYDFTYVTNDFEVTKAMLTVTADSQTKVYGKANPELTFEYNGWKNGDTESVLETKPTASTTVDQTTGFGTYTNAITLSPGTDNNYDITYVAADFAVTKAELTISGAKVENKVYDGNTDATITGALLSVVVGTDDVFLENYASGTFAQTGIGTGIDVTPAMTISGADISNYTLIQATGLKADITAKELRVNTAAATNKVYDGTTIAAIKGATLAGVVGTENVILSDPATGTFAQAGVGTDIEVTSAMTISGTDIANYMLTQPTGLKANITAKSLTVLNTVVVTNKFVDGNTTAVITSNGSLQGVVASDIDNVILAAKADYADANVGTNKTITVVYSLSGSAKGNYIVPANFVINGANISDNVALSPVITPAAGCEGSDLELGYTIVSGSSAEYKITFNEAALAAGIQNVSYTSMPSTSNNGVIQIPIPKGTREGSYQGTLRIRNEFGLESPEYTFSFSINLSSDYIIDKFEDVVLCDNSSKRFTAYQWYKDGVKIDGATKQFYCDPDGRVGVYSLEVVTIDGQTLISCGKGLNIPTPKKVFAYPNPMKADEVCTVNIFGFSDEELKNSELTVFNIQGVRVYQTKEVTNLNLMNLPAASGVYIGHVTSRNGIDYVFKIVVRQ